MAADDTRFGKVRKINHEKGFGFIAADDGTEYFLHATKCKPGVFERLKQDDGVKFTTKTPAAFDVDFAG